MMLQLSPWLSSIANLKILLTISAILKAYMCATKQATDPNKNLKDLYLLGLFPFSGAWAGGRSQLVAATLGLEQINSNPHVLPGYRLNILYNDTKCHPGLGVKLMVEQIYTPPTKIMLFGAGCSSVSEATARVSYLWNLVQLSYASASFALSDKKEYPLFARVNAPDTLTNEPKLELFRAFNWQRIATIHETHELFSSAIFDLLDKLHKENFSVLRSEIFNYDPVPHVQRLKKDDCKIIVGAFYFEQARKVFCEAYKLGLYGVRAVWILPGWYDNAWWQMEDNSISCTREQMAKAVEGIFKVGSIYFNPKEEPTVSGWLPFDFLKAYNDTVKGEDLPGHLRAPQGYDAIWAAALALNLTRQRLIEMGNKKRLEDFTYEDRDMALLLYSSLLNISFMGVQGQLSLNEKGDPVTSVVVDQVQSGVWRNVAMYNPTKEGIKFDWTPNKSIKWQGGEPVTDKMRTEIETVTVSWALYFVMCGMTVVGIILAISFLVFNIVLRKVKIVRMSSPNLNNVILLGCVFTYSSVFVLDEGGVYGTFGCQMRIVLLTTGVSLTFGALFAKTWRVHVIFSNTFQTKRVLGLHDRYLLVKVGVLVVLDLIVLILWWVLDPFWLENIPSDVEHKEDSRGDVKVTFVHVHCRSKHEKIFLGTLVIIHALLMIFGTFLAWETRNVHYEYLNDSKHIAMCIYNISLIAIPSVALMLTPSLNVNIEYALGSAITLIGTTITQGLLFIPKIQNYFGAKNSVDISAFTAARFSRQTGMGPSEGSRF